jgi:hypothetical protein
VSTVLPDAAVVPEVGLDAALLDAVFFADFFGADFLAIA